MSKIKLRKSGGVIWRESEAKYPPRQILIGLEPLSIVVRLKGTRAEYRLPIALIYQKAVEASVLADKPKHNRKNIRRGFLTGGLG
jgi:hypothetical protein